MLDVLLLLIKDGNNTTILLLLSILIRIINSNIVLKDTWEAFRRHKVDRKYHIECFCKYPCQGIESFKDIRWDDQQNDKTLIPVAGKLINDYHRPNEPMPSRETQVYLREQSNDLKREGYTGQQAMKILENQIE